MEKDYEKMYKYGERMEGKFSHKLHGNGIVISVTDPFVQEIHIECDNHLFSPYRSPYSLLAPQADHPEEKDSLIYYNTQEKCYYRFEWKGSGWEYNWVETPSRYIVEHAQKCEKLQAHFRMLHSIHKGQLCVFRGYAIDPNGDCKKPSTVESMFDRHEWFYNPWSFEVSLLNKDTIDDFVEETPISEEMAKKMVRYHKLERKVQRRTNIRQFGRNLLDKLSKFVLNFGQFTFRPKSTV